MSYEPEITDEGFEDVEHLIASLPPERRGLALDALDDAFLRLAANPKLASKGPVGRPTFFFSFEVGGTHYRWAATFCFSEDETKVIVTHVFRPTL
jgi:hypothetical protein